MATALKKIARVARAVFYGCCCFVYASLFQIMAWSDRIEYVMVDGVLLLGSIWLLLNEITPQFPREGEEK